MTSIPFHSRRSPVYATGGMVAATQPSAVRAGLRVLEAGGNAADAAIAAAAAISVTEPTSCGIGGDCYALYYDAKSAEVSALNGAGRAPAGLSLERLAADGFAKNLPHFHAHTVTVPGVIRGWCDLRERHGTRPLSELLAPAIELAEAGFPVAPKTAQMWQQSAGMELRFAVNGRALLLPDGNGKHRAPAVGEIFRNPDLARTLRRIAEHGGDGFYRGEVARAIAAAVAEGGGALSEDDLAAHTASTWEQPISVEYRGMRVWERPPAGQGLVALIALSLLSHLDDAIAADPLSSERMHAVLAALRIGFGDALAHLADPAAMRVTAAELLEPERIARLARGIDLSRAQRGPCTPPVPHGDETIYLSVVDGQGNACSYIESNYTRFGTGIVPKDTGFTLHNRGALFSLDPEHPNAFGPSKLSYHTLIPSVITRPDDSLYACLGVMGGWMQPQGHVQVILGLLDDGLDPQLALDRPRVRIDPNVGNITVEEESPPALIDELSEMGYLARTIRGHDRGIFGRGQVITRDADSGVLCGGSDLRGDGMALGI
ncbi:gamma-glutamyltransferase family protein [Haliangium ochraceum]|uniref:Gamma-glutamyltransferase n=1 Tax=Haliangium ochraceum (strain DSM 14365 / JCM 11303 / SMP-2) TaxID=502025 RepID=D0LXV2_HALO1|nr:gamma-glutamyltransferase family protein [Haliangium ochraceum]ACY14307.1 Gamma-glutamyltransferase [Haliangium ochraceum DSM 14365]